MTETTDRPKKVSGIRKFFRGLARVFRFIRASVLNLFVVLFLILVLSLIFIPSDERTPVPTNAVLVLDPSGRIVETKSRVESLPLGLIFTDYAAIETSVSDILKTLNSAASDNRIKGVLLDFSKVISIDVSQIERIRKAIKTFQESGKPVWAYAWSFNQVEYLLSMDADFVGIGELGEVFLSGLSLSTTFYKELLDTLNIDINVYAEGDYKSAVEPYTRTEMSRPVRDANTSMLSVLWDRIQNQIVEARGVEQADLNAYVTNFHQLVADNHVSFAELAVQEKLVDYILDRRELDAKLKGEFGNKIERIKFRHYVPHVTEPFSMGSKIALLVVEGTIASDTPYFEQPKQSLLSAIEKVSKRPDIKALVLRVNSPGGTVVASEELRRSIERFATKDKPVVASLAGTAASGGYWIALPASKIFATPVTLTGSIGVFGMYPSIENALAAIGVHTEDITSSPYGSLGNPFVTPTTETNELNALQVKRYYERFVSLVAKSRDMSVREVQEVAQGRVWLGSQAVENGLVDELGDLEEAIESAAELAGLRNYTIEEIRPPTGFFDISIVISNLQDQLVGSFSKLPDSVNKLATELTWLTDPRGIYAVCTACKVQT